LKHQKKSQNLKKIAASCKRFGLLKCLVFWHAMDFIRNLLKLAIISKSISRRVELCTEEQKFVVADGRKRNRESTVLDVLQSMMKGASDS